MDRGAWWATIQGGHKESDKTEVAELTMQWSIDFIKVSDENLIQLTLLNREVYKGISEMLPSDTVNFYSGLWMSIYRWVFIILASVLLKKKNFHHGIQEQHAYNNPTAKVIIIINIVNIILVTIKL